MAHDHHYNATVKWTGNLGLGTHNYKAYERSHSIAIGGKPDIEASSDPAFRGDKSKHNPEDLLLSALASCHMLWYLHLCADAGVVVVGYVDNATGVMVETPNGSGRFTDVTLHPCVAVADKSMVEMALSLHARAHGMCFIANSVNFPIHHRPIVLVSGEAFG
jgi:organic hydroperoxide reductase OsmC/OhrA